MMTIKNDSVLLHIEKGVATLTLHRPQVRNAFDDHMIALLTEYLYQIQQNDKVYAVVIKGEGGHFSAGADIQWMQKTIHYSKEENQRDALALANLLHIFNHLNKPTIAVVEGAVFGGAIGLVACADIAIATPDSTFCLSEVKLGLVPAIISPYVITAIGPRAARRYMLTAESFLAEEAHFIGLIHEVVFANQLEKQLNIFIQHIKQNGPKAIPIAKKMIHTLLEESFPSIAQREYTTQLISELRISEEAQEGLKAFLEKRTAKWQTS